MKIKNNGQVRELPLSNMLYRDDEIDIAKAEKLIVYHYPLTRSYRWKEWQVHLDSELSERYFPYLMRTYNGQFGLFVALDSSGDQPPQIKSSDDIVIEPERVKYSPELNPIWIRLIMRKVAAFGSHCKGSHSLGRPLLKVDIWKTKNSTGINAISLDCRTQQLKDRITTEVVLFHENVPLRPIPSGEEPVSTRGSLWVYDKNNVLVRWVPKPGEKRKGAVYREIPKSKNRRKQRSFIDLKNKKKLQGSWPYILQPVQDAFIAKAEEFGFCLKPKILHLQSLPLKTKHKNNSSKSSFPSIPLDKQVDVLDLRVSKAISGMAIVTRIQQVLDEKSLGTKLKLLPEVEPENLDALSFGKHQRILVLLDQAPGIIGDRYPSTKVLRTKVACQHINVNPFDLIGDSVEAGLLIEQSGEKGSTYLIPNVDSPYFDYQHEDFDKKDAKTALRRNAEIVIKELELKRLLLCEDAKISTSLPEQKDLLNEHLVVITDGYLFTVRDDRPVLLPFNPTNPAFVKACDEVLAYFDTSVVSLLKLLDREWPYNYRPEAVKQGFGSPLEKLTRFARKLTIVAHKDGKTSLMFQDPKYETPHMLPKGMFEVGEVLDKQQKRLQIDKWLLPNEEKLLLHLNDLIEEDEITTSSSATLKRELPLLCELWLKSLKEFAGRNELECDYGHAKKHMFKKWLALKNASLSPEEKSKKTANTRLISAWDTLLSRVLNLPLKDTRGWLRNVPGIQRLWYDPEKHYFIVGSLVSPKEQIQRQPSIRQWHALQGDMNAELLTALVDVDWVRMNQLAGNPCVATLVRRWRDCQSEPDEALGLKYIRDYELCSFN